MNATKNEDSSTPATTEAGVNRVIKFTKLAKVPSWTKDMSLETYTKQIPTWTGINEEVPEYVKFHDLMEELKKNKCIKGIYKYFVDHMIPVLINKMDQTLEKVIELLDVKYGWSRTEKVEDVMEDYLKFREDQYEDNYELILAMKELRQRRIELGMSFDEFVARKNDKEKEDKKL